MGISLLFHWGKFMWQKVHKQDKHIIHQKGNKITTMKSALYSVNSNSQTIAVGGTVNFGNTVRRFGNNIHMSGGNANLIGQGYYDINAHIGFTGLAGVTTITLYKDGIAIPGAVASITTANNALYDVNISALVRNFCCGESTITAVVSGVGATVTNATVKVEKV